MDAPLPHHGIARVLISGDQDAGLAYLPEAKALLRRTLERMRVGGLQQLSAHMRLADDAYCNVVVAAGINQIEIVADGRRGEAPTGTQYVDTPDFVSGAVQNGYVVEVAGDATQPAYKTLESFHPSLECSRKTGAARAYQSARRLAVEPADAFAGTLGNPNPDAINAKVFSQYTRLKPTMYSGTMRQLVQVLMGFGKPQLRGGLPWSRYDRTRGSQRAGVTRPKRSDYERQIAKNGLRVQYDWRWNRTHGVTFGADGKPWLVEIGSTQGVVAFPLELHPNTTPPAFRERMADEGDTEAVTILDRFGGFPTGEPMPSGKAMDAWVRAGRALRLLPREEMRPYYDSYNAYGTQLGWAFNLRGDEAHNTAWRFGDDDVQRGAHFQVSLQIGAQQPIKPKADAAALWQALAKLGDMDGRAAAVSWKLDRLSDFELRAARSALSRSANEAFEYVDALVLNPVAGGSARLTKLSEGALWYPFPAKVENGAIFRFPEPALGFLLAHSMKPASNVPAPKRCDTVVHVFFNENQLVWVKFFRDGTPGKPGTATDNFEGCMYIGEWKQHIDQGTLQVPPMFYTSEFDDREELAAGTTDLTIKGTDRGYTSITAADDPVDPSTGAAHRTKTFLMRYETNTVQSPWLATGVAVPFYEREAYYYAIFRSDAGTSRLVQYSEKSLGDPWYAVYKRNFPGYYGWYVGEGTARDPWRPARLLDVYGYGPNEYRTAAPDAPLYDASSPCRDIADSGPWVHGGDNIDRMRYSLVLPVPPNESESTGPAGSYDVWLMDSSGFGQRRTAIVPSLSFNLWPLWTPDMGDGYSWDQYIEATRNASGDAEIARYSINLNDATVLRGAPQWPGMERGSLTFVGVVHG